jgi:hypothetical protein
MNDAEALWTEHGKNKMTLLQRIDKYHGLSGQMERTSLRVVYSKAGTNPTAAIIRDKSALVDHKLYWAEISSEAEANYLVATLNSDAIRDHVASRQSRGQWGPRDFDKLLAEAIPEFESANPLHKELAAEALCAEKVAAQVALPEGIYFVHARGLIRKALKEDGVADRIEKLVTRLLVKL